MRISVVIPALNEQGCIEECLRSMRAQDLPCELIVVDNGSVDETVSIAERYADVVLVQPDRSLAEIRGAGVEASNGEVIVSTDADCVAPKGWLRELTAPFSDPEVAAVGGPFRPTNRGLLPGMFCFFASLTLQLGLFCGGNMGFRRASYEATRGYSGARRAEDWVLSWRLRVAGRRVAAMSAFMRTGVPTNRQLEYPLGILSLAMLIWGLVLGLRVPVGFAAGYYGSIGYSLIAGRKRSITLAGTGIVIALFLVVFGGTLDSVISRYMLGGSAGILSFAELSPLARGGKSTLKLVSYLLDQSGRLPS